MIIFQRVVLVTIADLSGDLRINVQSGFSLFGNIADCLKGQLDLLMLSEIGKRRERLEYTGFVDGFD